jgi:Eco29kI restriction endonuclease
MRHPYAQISCSETPIYVGQASPAKANARAPMEQGDRLARRLDDHRRNIAKATSTLSIDDFECRMLVVQSGWETAAEDYLIDLFKPIWNNETNILYGLGKHGDDADTRANKRSPWDTLHPGREWAAKTTQDARTPQQIQTDLRQHFQGRPKTPGSGRRKKGAPADPPPKHLRYRTQLAARGIADSFDVLREMEGLAKVFLDTAEAEKARGEDADQKHIEELMAKAYPILRDIAPYKHPRLAAVMVQNDRRPLNLSTLSDAELAFLRQILLKANAAPPTINVMPAIETEAEPEKKSGPPR